MKINAKYHPKRSRNDGEKSEFARLLAILQEEKANMPKSRVKSSITQNRKTPLSEQASLL